MDTTIVKTFDGLQATQKLIAIAFYEADLHPTIVHVRKVRVVLISCCWGSLQKTESESIVANELNLLILSQAFIGPFFRNSSIGVASHYSFLRTERVLPWLLVMIKIIFL